MKMRPQTLAQDCPGNTRECLPTLMLILWNLKRIGFTKENNDNVHTISEVLPVFRAVGPLETSRATSIFHHGQY